jgi:hypothetical protein
MPFSNAKLIGWELKRGYHTGFSEDWQQSIAT